jgi:protein phosphatase
LQVFSREADSGVEMVLESFGKSDVGSVRKHNEDNFLVKEDLGLFIVADGLGGHAAGEVASKIVVDRIERYISDTAGQGDALGKPEAGLSANGQRLKNAVLMSDKAITDDIALHPERETMGSTVVACLIEGKTVTMAHVGDSRAYMLGRGGIKQLTKDHSWVADQVESGFMTAAEAKRHPFRNVITQALGNGIDLEVSIQEFEMADGEALLLCSDGLTGMVSDDQIFSIYNQASNLQGAVNGLVSKAIDNGGEDNVSVVIVRHCHS